MSNVLVTGANGFVGSHVVPALLEAGHDVVAVTRTPAGGQAVVARLDPGRRARVQLRQADVTRRDTLPAALEGVDAVVHLVAIPRDLDGGTSLRRVNTEGTRNVLVASRSAGIRRFIHLGAMGVVDDPSLHYASSKARAIELVKASGVDWTVLSPSLLFGPRDGFFNIVADLVRMSPGIVPITGRGRARFQPLAIGDLARIVVRCLQDDVTIGHEYLLGGPRVFTYREIVQVVLLGMGRGRVILPIPVPLIRLVAGSAERLHVPFPVATDQLRQLRFDNVGPPDGVRAGFGFDPQSMDAIALRYLRRRKRDQWDRPQFAGDDDRP